MPVFYSMEPEPAAVSPGTYLGRVIKAADRVSANNNVMITMAIELLPGRERLSSTLTFVENARPVIAAACRSAGLIMPDKAGVGVEVTARNFLNRVLYFKIEADENGAPRITRFMTREQALAADPRLAAIPVQLQPAVSLLVVQQREDQQQSESGPEEVE